MKFVFCTTDWQHLPEPRIESVFIGNLPDDWEDNNEDLISNLHSKLENEFGTIDCGGEDSLIEWDFVDISNEEDKSKRAYDLDRAVKIGKQFLGIL